MNRTEKPVGSRTIADYLDWDQRDCPCGRPHRIMTSTVIIGDDALDRLPEVLAPHLGGRRVAVFNDAITREIAGTRAIRLLERAHLAVTDVIVPNYPGSGHPVCARETIDALDRALDQVDGVVAVGAGTVNDIAKSISHRRRIPYLTVPTAPSMNGYTSSIVALLEDGVKKTLPAHQPVAVVAEPAILAAAPAEMLIAGVGDLLSKPVCTTDWVLAREVKGEYFCTLPGEMVDAGIRRLVDSAAGIRDGDLGAIAALMETIVLSGFSMAIAGTSSPASGAEHLISHYWDMGRYAAGHAPLALHGTQVGIASLITARLYDRLLQLETLPVANLPEPLSDPAALEHQIREAHRALPSYVVDGIVEQSNAKFLTAEAQLAEREQWRSQWPMLRQALRDSSTMRGRIAETLSLIGAPLTPQAIGISREQAIHTVRFAKDMRSRYTLFDFLQSYGLLDRWATEVVPD